MFAFKDVSENEDTGTKGVGRTGEGTCGGSLRKRAETKGGGKK